MHSWDLNCKSTQQRSVDVLLLLRTVSAWQGPGLGLPEPSDPGKKTSPLGLPETLAVVMLRNCRNQLFFREMKGLDLRKPETKMGAVGQGQVGEGR